MTIVSLLAYTAAVTLAIITPGPAAIAVAATGIAQGTPAAIRAAFGVAVADGLLVILAMAGLAAVIGSHGGSITILKFCGAAYLAYLGYRMWKSRASGAASVQGAPFMAGFSIAIGNPKAIFFHASLMPLFLNLTTMTVPEAGLISIIVIVANLIGMGGYVAISRLAATRARVLNASTLNRISAAVMMITAAAVLAL